MNINAYHNSDKLKAEAIASAKKHIKQDMLIKGTYGELDGSFKGCSVGCDAFEITGKVSDDCHAITSKYYGFPEWVEHLRDMLFEGLPDKESKEWHLNLKQSIPVGLDEVGFNKVKAKFLIYILKGNIELVEGLDISDALKKQVLAAINQCLSVQEQAEESGLVDKAAAFAATRAAESAMSASWSAESAEPAEPAAWAAESAAESATRVAESAESIVWSAARAAARAAESATRAAERPVVWAASSADSAMSATYIDHANQLIKLFKEAT